MHSDKIRNKFLSFFEKRGHAIIPSASLVPEGDSSTLFTTAGMQPLVPYLLGQKHPSGVRLANVQKCLRTGDIDEVGDNTHLTFFEMLGNWSLGDYWKKEAIEWSFQFLTDEKEGLGLKKERLYITVFSGEGDIPADDESKKIWMEQGIAENRIFERSAKDNWWAPGENGPAGPSTEMFYDVTGTLGDVSPEEFEQADEEQKVVEIWNNVFMEYEQKEGKVIGKLAQRNVDTGMGLERVAAVLQGVESVFETDVFESILNILPAGDDRARRIVADHIRAAVFAISDGVEPSNTDRGYIVRRLIRRAVRYADTLGMSAGALAELVAVIANQYGDSYSHVLKNMRIIQEAISGEEEKFRKTLEKGLREIEKLFGIGTFTHIEPGKDVGDYPAMNEVEVDPEKAFLIFQTYGFPLELIQEELAKRALFVDEKKFQMALEKHQEKSRTAAAGKFKGGLADSGEETTKLHTAHHLLLAALQRVLGGAVKQRGSNITPERLRIDFSFDRKLTDEEKQRVEGLVNEWIAGGLSVERQEMSREEAEQIGAEMEFGTKYPDTVSVFFIKDKDGTVISKEFCAGPHAHTTGDLGHFRIKKEEASSAGVRRIKATLDK